MLPILFSVGSFNFYTLGLMLGVGFLLSAFIVWKRLKELSLKEEKVIDLIILSGALGLIFSRLFYILQNLPDFNLFLGKWINFSRFPGFSYFGAVFGLFVVLFWFTKKAKWNFWQMGDEIIFGMVPLMILAQIGCFLDGSGQGKPTIMPWGVFFPGSLLRRQPLSVFTALILFLIWIFLLRIEREWRFWDWYKSKANGLLLLVFWGLFFASNIPLAFLKDSKIYFLLLDVGGNLLGLLATAAVFMKKAVIKFPMNIIKPIGDFLSGEVRKLERRKKELSTTDPFSDASRVIDNAASDQDATEQVGHARVSAMQSQVDRKLIQLKTALSRIKIGKYGLCEKCGKMIDTDRLMIMPEATLCAHCAKKKES